jgi:hypothetical protein
MLQILSEALGIFPMNVMDGLPTVEDTYRSLNFVVLLCFLFHVCLLSDLEVKTLELLKNLYFFSKIKKAIFNRHIFMTN